MERKLTILALVALFLIVLSLRLHYAFESPNFSDDESYFSLRQAQSILDTGFPIFKDDLSYQGKFHLFSPVYDYIIAFFGLFCSISIAAKLVSNLLATSLVIIMFLIAKELTKSNVASVGVSIISSFIPIFFIETIRTSSPYTLMVPLVFLAIYFFMKIEQGNIFVVMFLITIFLAGITHPSSIVIVIGFILYYLITKAENLVQHKAEAEVLIFSVIFVSMLQFIIYNKAFLVHGLGVIWQNIPSEFMSKYFSSLSIASSIYQLGLMVVAAGTFMIYHYMFKSKDRKIYLIISFAFSALLLIFLKLIPFKPGLFYLGFSLSILYGFYLMKYREYLGKTKFAKIEPLFLSFFILSFVITSIIPTIYLSESKQTYTQDGIDALVWASSNTNSKSTILGNLYDGNAITYFSNRKNFADSDFLLARDAEQRLKDAEIMFTSPYETEALELIEEYNIDYLYKTPESVQYYGKNIFTYAESSNCFRKLYSHNGYVIYAPVCKLMVSK